MEFVNRGPIDEVAALGVPFPEEVVINHGAALVIWGVREERPNGDIDAATSLENNLYLENKLSFTALQMPVGVNQDGKERTVVSRRDPEERFDIHRWDFSMYRWNRTKKGRLHLPELGSRSLIPVFGSQRPNWYAKPCSKPAGRKTKRWSHSSMPILKSILKEKTPWTYAAGSFLFFRRPLYGSHGVGLGDRCEYRVFQL